MYGGLSDVFGRNMGIYTAIVLFALGSCLCAIANDMSWMVAARIIQGSGAGGTLSLVSVIITELTSLRERGLYMALTAMAWAVGVIVGVSISSVI